MRTGKLKITSILLVGLMLAGVIGGCGITRKTEELDYRGNMALAADYSSYYKEVPVNEQPRLKPYKAAADLSNVENSNRFEFSPDARQHLVENGFVVLPEPGVEFFLAYELNRYDNTPNLITTDAMLHNYHIFFQHLLKTIEQEQLIPELKKLNAGMAEAAGIAKKDAAAALDALVNMAYQGARDGFTIPGLGKLVLAERLARKGRNPATGEIIDIPAKKVVKFRLAKAAKDAVL